VVGWNYITRWSDRQKWIGTFMICKPAAAIVSSVGSAMSEATGRPMQRHLVYAQNQRAWWLIFLSGTQTLSALYSTDFTNWNTPTGSPFTLANTHNSLGRSLSCSYDNLASTDVLHAHIFESNGQLVHSRYTLGSTWSRTNAEANVVASTASGSNFVNCPTICLDSNAKPWYAGSGVGGNSCAGSSATNADSGTSWTAGFNGASVIFNAGPYCSSSAVFNAGSGNVLAITDNASSSFTATRLKWNVGSGSTFGAAANVGSSAFIHDHETNAWGACRRTSSDIHAVALTGDSIAPSFSNNTGNVYTHYRYNGSTFDDSGDTFPAVNYGLFSGIFLESDGTNVWAFLFDDQKQLQYTKWTSGSGWSAMSPLGPPRTNQPQYLTGSYGNGDIGLVWTEANGGNFDIYGATLGTICADVPVVPNPGIFTEHRKRFSSLPHRLTAGWAHVPHTANRLPANPPTVATPLRGVSARFTQADDGG